MRIPHAAVPGLRLVTVAAFVAACALVFGYLWVNMGGRLPVISSDGYRVSFDSPDVDNLVDDSDVMIAGVKVGKVASLTQQGGTAHVVIQLDDHAAWPLHRGAVIRFRSKSLIEETYVDVTDGHGAALPDGAALPSSSVKKSVQLDDVLASLDAPTRRDLGSTLRSLGQATGETAPQLNQTMTGLGDLGRQGHDVLDALDAQSQDLRQLVKSSTQMMNALDTGQGRLVDLVDKADSLTNATSQESTDLSATMKALPGLLTTTDAATRSLTGLTHDLRPITTGLRQSAAPLDAALQQLPATTADLRGLLPDLNKTLDAAPATLTRVPATSKDVVAITPTARATLADVNPMLAYIAPYAPDIAAFFTNWTAMLANSDVNGHYVRVFPVINAQSIKGDPLPLNTGLLDESNAYPAPGESTNPGPFSGTYPHVERDPE